MSAILTKADFSPEYLNRIQTIGMEVEGFSKKKLEVEIPGCGKRIGEAGKHMFELITAPYYDVASSFGALRRLINGDEGNVSFVPSRPTKFGQEIIWEKKPRYNALREALEIEVPGQSHLVDKMTTHAAIHVNFSGELIDPFGKDGVFLNNMINNLAPLLAALVHKEVGRGKEHLSIWQKFAKPERFPQYGCWFKDSEDMIHFIESLPSLFAVTDNDELHVYPGSKQSINNPVDLTFMWRFLRPKIGPIGPYLELRYLPSMKLDLAEKYVNQAVDLIEILLEWFWYCNDGQPVTCIEEAEGAFEFLARRSRIDLLSKPLTEDQWHDLFNNH